MENESAIVSAYAVVTVDRIDIAASHGVERRRKGAGCLTGRGVANDLITSNTGHVA